MEITRFMVGLATLFLPSVNLQALTMDFVTVGNPGNLPDPIRSISIPGIGSVANTYAIGKYEVTNAQYTEFLNTVDPAGTNTFNLYNSNMGSDARGGINFNAVAAPGSHYELKLGRNQNPVVFVSFWDVTRFANWMHNGMTAASTTEMGAYDLLSAYVGGNPNNINDSAVTREPNARFWIPSESEWYKAAYHQPAEQGGDSDNYWAYPLQTNSAPFSDQPPGATPDNTRVGNFNNEDFTANGYDDGFAVTGSSNFMDAQNYLTNVGAYTQTDNFYGTFDQGGNVWEWNDTMVPSSSLRGRRGGSWLDYGSWVAIRNFAGEPEHYSVGFRVATVPEPMAGGMLTLGAFLLLSKRRRPF
jgi:formylglycine-generating enzyme